MNSVICVSSEICATPPVRSYSVMPRSPYLRKICPSRRNSTAYPRVSPAAPPNYPETSLAIALYVTDPASIAAAVQAAKAKFGQIDVLESENPPLRLLLGSDAVKAVRSTLEARIRELDAWEAYSVRTDFES